jgi:hypothetical protein
VAVAVGHCRAAIRHPNFGRIGVMKNVIARRSAGALARLRLLGPILLVAASLIVAACNNGSGGSSY